ncbi:GNAT family N-acetyltransferase [Pantoea sp. CS_6]|uniref:GNAT family N-acetyltransferase n=1 Tax=Pantoea TaxID=53335 RepID=UPI00062F9301|nr:MULTISPECIES: GNAT family N-acetyltransferase [Pantoea]KKW50335.1 GCN5-related N-acetyltransferase [Pantoea ananatis]KTS28271.1 GCN5-related N-acetyltransferase [Pantoea stewartii]MDK2635250.1 GNAT family N-acetyltransferase [Pantoea stewartii subsp. indologenes]UYK98870.1 GNAT family N-acetyltransferase [Pantoea stewartii]WRH13608.1 GNAT family N-acetyltransferase [Pantoea sp. JZ2]
MKCVNAASFLPVCGDAVIADLAEQQRLRLLSPRKWFRETMEVNTDPSMLNPRLIAQWLGSAIPDARLLTLALNSSLCFGLYRHTRQIGFARVVTDMAETWVIQDLFISPEYRYIGLGSWLLHCCLTHPGASGCHRIIALSDSAQDFLERNGFICHASLPGLYLRAVAPYGLSDSLSADRAHHH